MGISFKISKAGKRYKPKPVVTDTIVGDDDDLTEKRAILARNQLALRNRKTEINVTSGDEEVAVPDHEVSFILKLFQDGYFIGKPSESEPAHQATPQDVPKFLHPYDRASEPLFSAIESGRLPGDILEDIPCKFVDGAIMCEVRDYRNPSETGLTAPADGSPIVNKVRLRMTMENVVKDIPSISDSTWTYGDLMEVEARILKALQPKLHLDPNPKFDRLCTNPAPTKLNLLCSIRKKRQRLVPEIIVTSDNRIHGKKVCIDRVPESSNCRVGDAMPVVSGNILPQQVRDNLSLQNAGSNNVIAQRNKNFVPEASVPVSHRYQMGHGNPRLLQNQGSGPIPNAPGASPGGHDTISQNDNLNSSSVIQGKRDNQDGPLSPLSNLNKKARQTSLVPDGNQQHHMASRMENFHGSESQWKNTLLQQQSIARGMQYANNGLQKYPQQMFEGVLNQEAGVTQLASTHLGMRYAKEEPVELERLDKPEANLNRNEMQQRLSQHAFMRSNFPQTPWNSHGQPLDNSSRKEDQFPKRKTAQSPRVSTGGLPQSPLSSRSGEFSSGSMGQFGLAATTSALGPSLKDKPAVNSVPAMGGATSLNSSANDSMQRQHHAQMAAKRRSNSLPKTPAMSGVASPVSVGNISIPFNASSPPVGTPPLADQLILDRFSKLEVVASRHQISSRKSKADVKPIRKNPTYPTQQLALQLSSDSNENFRDDGCTMPLSKSLVGGSINVHKIRVLNFVQTERLLQGNGYSYVPKARTRMIMSVKPTDGTIAIHYGDIDDGDFLNVEEYLPTLSSVHVADLLAAQLSTLMSREGYHVEDHIQPKPIRTNRTSSTQSNAVGNLQNNAVDMQQYSDGVSGQPSNEVAKPSCSVNSPLNPTQNPQGTRMLPPGNAHSQFSQGLMAGVPVPARPQQMDSQQPLQQQQQQQQQQPSPYSLMQQPQPQFQRSPLVLASNPLSHMNTVGQNPNMAMGNHMVNKPNALQLQMLQQQQQQQPQQQSTMQQRKMLMGLRAGVGMGNMSNNMVGGLGGLGSVMSMGGGRGIGGNSISAPMGTISGMGSVSQASNISNAISQQLRSGTLSAAQEQALKQMMGPGRSNILGGPQSSLGGISAARQMLPGSAGLSMLSRNINRAGINPMQRTAMGPMGPPKLMPGMNLYVNQQQQQQQLQLQQQQLQQQQLQLQQQQQQQHFQQQQQQLQQETTSPLQAVLSPQQVGSPSTLTIQPQLSQQLQQQASPQQMSQRTPMSPQLSSGAMHTLSAGNPEACPASPQLSSQTLGSVGSITNSPMELQGANKSNSGCNP